MYIKIDGAELNSFKDKKIILFGASSTGVKAVEEFENIGSRIVGFCDNSPSKKGTALEGYTIYAPDDLYSMQKEDNGLCIMITSTYEEEIKKQLYDMGMDNVYTVHMGVLHDKMPFSEFSNKILEKEEANERLIEMLVSDVPFFVGRVGSVELEIICNYLYFTGRLNKVDIPYSKNITNMLCDWAGFFPPDNGLIDRFCELYLKEIKSADLLWCMWESRYENKLYSEYCPGVSLSLYDDTGFPVDMVNPWTAALSGKKVLVIHPFEKSIINNYQIKEKLFRNCEFMPDFELITIKAVQTQADSEDERFVTWFDALESMKHQIEETDFDVVLIGAGAYGFPLGAYAKQLGKQALHIGGMLQLYFGIRGKYYDDFNYHNEYWTRPLEEERPEGYKKVEAGRYW